MYFGWKMTGAITAIRYGTRYKVYMLGVFSIAFWWKVWLRRHCLLPSNSHQRDNLIISQVIFIINSDTNTGLTFSIQYRDQFLFCNYLKILTFKFAYLYLYLIWVFLLHVSQSGLEIYVLSYDMLHSRLLGANFYLIPSSITQFQPPHPSFYFFSIPYTTVCPWLYQIMSC